jgi:hypothetical protein
MRGGALGLGGEASREPAEEEVGSLRFRGTAKTMWDFLVYALLGLATIGSVLYVTLSPETEDPPKPIRPDIEQ